MVNKAVKQNRMIVIDGVDGSGKGVQSRRLQQSFIEAGHEVLLTREPGGSAPAEEIRQLLVNGEPERWDSMTELLLMYAARRSHLRDTLLPALAAGKWIISDRYADSSRAFQGVAGELGLATVEKIHQIVVGDFTPALVIILDVPENVALERTFVRASGENRFESKGARYHARVRQAFLDIAMGAPDLYRVIDAAQTMDKVSNDIISSINDRFGLGLSANYVTS